jgi:Fe-S-cluster-containing dehydrogenase component
MRKYKKGMEKVLIFDADKCTGCKMCQLACSYVKHGEFNPNKSCIQVMKNKEMDVNIVALDTKCDFCGKCIEWCLPQAIKLVDRKEAVVKWKGVKLGSFPAPRIKVR